MRKLGFLVFLILFGVSFSNDAFSQVNTGKDVVITDSTRYVVTKIDGTEYIGYIVADDGREILMVTDKLGKIYLPKSEVKTIVVIYEKKEVIYGEYNFLGPFTTRYSFTNNAFPIKKGENYALLNIYGPEVHFAITEKLNIGLMTTWAASPMILALKYTFNGEDAKIKFSAGTLMGSSTYINGFRGFGGLHWLSVTKGDRKNNFTFSAGYGYLQAGGYNYFPPEGTYSQYPEEIGYYQPFNSGPLASLAGIIKVGAKTSLILDAMGIYYQRNDYYSTETLISDGYMDGTGMYVEPVFNYETGKSKSSALALIFMPGMRIQKTETRAFQISLTGISVFTTRKVNGETIRDNNSFPFPMCTWLFRF